MLLPPVPLLTAGYTRWRSGHPHPHGLHHPRQRRRGELRRGDSRPFDGGNTSGSGSTTRGGHGSRSGPMQPWEREGGEAFWRDAAITNPGIPRAPVRSRGEEGSGRLAMETSIAVEVIDTSRVVCFLEPMQGTEPRSVRAGGDERMPWDALVGQVAADLIGYAGEEFCSRSPPNFFR